MADVNKLLPFILQWESGFVNDPDDAGGPTNKGVTLTAWRSVGYDKTGDGLIDIDDLKLLTVSDVLNRVLKPHYWDRWQADRIQNQSVANILVDWLWTSGAPGIKIPQELLKVKADGIVGPITLHAVNSFPNQADLFHRIQVARIDFIYDICRRRPVNEKFKRGWLNRIHALKYE